jgi:hypothetical protein
MSSRDLSPGAAALLRAGRGAFRPDEADRERILRSLPLALGEISGSIDTSHRVVAKPGLAGRFTLKTWLLGGVSVIALGTGALALRYARPAVQADSVVAIAPAAQEASSDAVAASAHALDTPLRTSMPGAAHLNAGAARGSVDSLPEEVRLLSRAEKQLNAGLAVDALRTLTEHERRFPNGGLAEERLAARVHALCALGRTREARADIAKLSRAYPKSPHLESARRFCATDPASSSHF